MGVYGAGGLLCEDEWWRKVEDMCLQIYEEKQSWREGGGGDGDAVRINDDKPEVNFYICIWAVHRGSSNKLQSEALCQKLFKGYTLPCDVEKE